jgi:hypothetical protein
MQNFKLLLLCFCLTLLVGVTSCKKEKIDSKGTAAAYINGIYWQGEVRIISRYGKFDMTLEKYKRIEGTNVPWEIMGIQYFNKNLNTQKLINGDSVSIYAPWNAIDAYGSFGTAQSDGDVGCDFYEIIESDSTNNWVRIEKQSNEYNEVWGSFSMHLYRTRTCSSTIYPDTLLITNGEFHFKL